MCLEWFVVATRRNNWRVVTKPAPMISLILWFTVTGHWQGDLIWFGLALVFSLLGDIFLLFPFRSFVLGLTAFSLTHICFIVGFFQTPVNLSGLALGIIFIILAIAVVDLLPIFRGVRRHPSTYNLFPPVLFYGCIITLMLLSAWLTLARPGWELTPNILVVAGASLFYVSDSVLAREKFIIPIKHGGVIIMVTYLLAQLLIAIGVVGHYSGALK
jgi:uncharacterized membrane protein YhhN